MNDIVTGLDPAEPVTQAELLAEYTKEGRTDFSPQDLSAAEAQLSKEQGYLANIQNYATLMTDVLGQDNTGMASSITAAASDVSSSVEDAMPDTFQLPPQQSLTNARLAIAGDVFNTVAGIVSAFLHLLRYLA